MSDKQQKQEDLVDVIKKGSTIKVEIPVDLYYRLNQFILYGFPFSSEEDLKETMQKVKDGKEDSNNSYYLRTLIAVQLLIEKAAREQNLVEKKTIQELQEEFNVTPSLENEDQG